MSNTIRTGQRKVSTPIGRSRGCHSRLLILSVPGIFLFLFANQLTTIARPESKPPKSATVITVAQDGTGQFTSVQDAIMSVPSGSAADPVVIRIKRGTYKELIYIQHEKRFFRLVGEDSTTTILTFDLHANMIGKDGRPIGTFRTPSTKIAAVY